LLSARKLNIKSALVAARTLSYFAMRVFLLLLALLPLQAAAQDWPTKPVRMVVPYAAGGLPDTMARLVGQKMGEALGQNVLVENRPGAGGISGTELVVKSPADGYTLLIADVGQVAINPHLYAKLPYDPLKDLAPVSLIGTSTLFLVAHSAVPANTFAELVALARAQPGKLNYGSSGTGSIMHIATEVLKAALKLDLVHVPYKGTAQSVPALLGGQVSLLYSALPSIESHVKAGRVKLLAVSTLKRSPEAPTVATIAELGVAGYDFAPEIGLLAPAGTPPAVIRRLAAEMAKAVRAAEVAQRFVQLGIEPAGTTPEAYAAIIRSSYDRYREAVRISGARAE
jgi:tripartite-type tricarboxylate transporter receptor subunit TctC